MMRALHGLVTLVVFTCLSAPSLAQSDEVVALFERGLEAYRLANYEEAEEFFAQAHALDPLPDLSYNLARTLELLGRFGDAADVYTRFLQEAPDADDHDVIQARIENLRARQARVLIVEVAEPEPVEEAPVATAPEAERPSLVGPLIVIGGGLAFGVAGLATGIAGTSAHDAALNSTTNQIDVDAANGRADRLARTTNVLLALGGAVLAGGMTWLVVKLTRGGGESEVSLHIAPTGVTVHGAF